VLIVAGHSYPPWAIDSIPEMILANLINGGTALFVFISGFFFHHVFYTNFHYKRFIIKKSKNVLLPYAVFSTIGFTYIVIYLNMPHSMLTRELNTFYDVFILFAQYLWTGRTLTGYWYIPFIMIIFIISPLFVAYIKLSIQRQVYIFIVMLCISMLIHRPEYSLSPFHSVIYFSPIYLFGIIFSMQKDTVLKHINNRTLILGIAVLAVSLTQVILYGTFGNFHKPTMISFNGVDILIIQKTFMILFFLSMLQKINHREIPTLKYIASISFAIYFLHPYVLFFMSYYSLAQYIDFLPGFAIFVIKTFLAVSISVIIANLIKVTMHKKSAYVVGW